jgi:hypothetical protein
VPRIAPDVQGTAFAQSKRQRTELPRLDTAPSVVKVAPAPTAAVAGPVGAVGLLIGSTAGIESVASGGWYLGADRDNGFGVRLGVNPGGSDRIGSDLTIPMRWPSIPPAGCSSGPTQAVRFSEEEAEGLISVAVETETQYPRTRRFFCSMQHGGRSRVRSPTRTAIFRFRALRPAHSGYVQTAHSLLYTRPFTLNLQSAVRFSKSQLPH